MKTPGKVGFSQPNHGTTGNSTTKQKTQVPFKQNPSIGQAGKKSTKNPTHVPFKQNPKATKTASSTAKVPGRASFNQPNHGGSAVMPKEKAGVKSLGEKTKKAAKVSPEIKDLNDVVAYRKKVHGN